MNFKACAYMYVRAPETRIDFKMSVKKLMHEKNPKAAISFKQEWCFETISTETPKAQFLSS